MDSYFVAILIRSQIEAEEDQREADQIQICRDYMRYEVRGIEPETLYDQ